MSEPKRKVLNDKNEIPLIGLGTRRIFIDEYSNVVYNSIKSGVRLIDNSPRYQNEKEVGKGIKKALDENICKREDLLIISKIWLNDREDPEKAIRSTLNNLDKDYLDLYLDHWPSGKDYRKEATDRYNCVSVYDFWPKMEKLVEKGLTKSIGVSNYNIQCLNNLLSFCKIKPAVNEIEFQLYYYQKSLKEFCDKENITVIAYYPLTYGYGARVYIAEHYGEFDVFEEKIIKDLAKKYQKDLGQIILNWHHHQSVIPIPANSKEFRKKDNLESLEFIMEDEDYELISKYFAPLRKKFFVNNRYF
jgi:diketogulonate reductase-like aldo/keto reductase